MSHVENWMGKALPVKKRGGYYSQPLPELGMRISNNFKSKLDKPLLNGGNIGAKPKKCGKVKVSLSNTCAFDSLVHLFASAICDSSSFREATETMQSSVVSLAKYMAINGINDFVYVERTKILLESLPKSFQSDSGLELVLLDCAISASDLAKYLNIPPSILDISTCSSPYCPEKTVSGPIVTVGASPYTMSTEGMASLQQAIDNNRQHFSSCGRPFPNKEGFEEVPAHWLINWPIDKTFSENVVCGGTRAHREESQHSLLVSVPGVALESNGPAHETAISERPFECRLSEIPVTLTFAAQKFVLRGAVGFDTPRVTRRRAFSSAGIGHYTAYCRRIGGSWKVFDDLVRKQKHVTDNAIIGIDLLLYTRD